MVEVTDDCGGVVSTETLYYDAEVGECVSLSVEDETVVEREVFEGHELMSWDIEMFKEECMSGDFLELSDEVITQPKEVMDCVITNVLSDARDNFAGYEPWEIRFAWRNLDCTQRDLTVE